MYDDDADTSTSKMAAFAAADDFLNNTVDEIANRQEDRAPPWRTPADNLKKKVAMEPQRTQVIDDRNRSSIMHTSLTGNLLAIS